MRTSRRPFLATMSNKNISSAAFADTKPHYPLLDGLRGVAALMVVWFHIFEAFATSHLDQRINHGYLAVDFFFILSGFVIGIVISKGSFGIFYTVILVFNRTG